MSKLTMSSDAGLEVLEPEANQGYLPRPIPDPCDNEISDLLRRTIEQQTVAVFTRLVQRGHGIVLATFAERMASAAIRNTDPTTLRLGLIALLLSYRSADSREALTIFPLFCDALQKLGLDQTLFVSEIRSTIGDQLADPFVEFLKRSERDRSLEAMGYSEGTDSGGFRYVRNW